MKSNDKKNAKDRKKTIGIKYLLFLAFISGFTIMSIELAASRLLAPYFGSSLFVWTNIIGLIMIFLAAGYYLGGKLADKNPDPYLIIKIIFFSGVIIFFIPFLVNPVVNMTTFEALIDNYAAVVILLGSFLSTLFLFIFPITLLGMVSPFMIKLLIKADQDNEKNKNQAGTKAGMVFALSTIGSIIGTYITALIAIPFLGTKNTVFLAAGILVLFTFWFVFNRKWPVFVALPLILATGFCWNYLEKTKRADGMVLEDESMYHDIKIRKRGKLQYLHLISDSSYSSVYMPELKFSDSYYDYFSILPYVDDGKKDKDVLIMGLAGGTMVHQYNNLLEGEFDFNIDGIEIDSKLSSIVREKFNLEYDNLNVYNSDGRMFLSQNDNKYDIIIIDAFSKQLYIPHHLSTKEFFGEITPHLSDKGVVGVNVVAISPESPLLKTFTNTLASEFEYVYVAPIKYSYNYFVVASNEKIKFSDIVGKIQDKQLKDLAITVKSTEQEVEFDEKRLVLTDDRAPIEYLTDKMAFEYFYH